MVCGCTVALLYCDCASTVGVQSPYCNVAAAAVTVTATATSATVNATVNAAAPPDDDGDFYSVALAFLQTTGNKGMGVSEMA